MKAFFIMLLLGVVLCVVVAVLSFFDFVGIIALILPNKKIAGYDEYISFKRSNDFKTHRNKWMKILSLCSCVVYVVLYAALSMLLENIEESFLIALFISFIVTGIFKGKESKQRKDVEKKFNANK